MPGFTDANIPFDSANPLRTEQMLIALQKMGYKTAVVNQTIELISQITPAPKTESWKSKVQPQTEKLFQQCCGSLEVDVIALDMTQRIPFYLKPAQLRQAVERGIHFEILYSPMILDSTARQHIISTAKDLVELTKGKNVIISSGAEKPINLRGPYDVINLALLFGFKETFARKAILDNCRSALLHAQTRNTTAKGVVSVKSVDELKAEDLWQLKQHTDDMSEATVDGSGSKKKKKHSRQTENDSDLSSVSKQAKLDTDRDID
jgi:ribonuclease P/MRP protein subunit RPP1